MKYVTALLSALALVVALPTIADARADWRGGGHGGGGRGGQFFLAGGGERNFGGGRRENPNKGYRPDRQERRQEARPDRRSYDRPPPYERRDRPPNSLGADWRQQQDEARQGVRQGRYVPLGRVLPELRRRSPGRQLDAGIERGADGRPVYRVRWGAANGRRIDYIIDAQTGQVIGVER